jgi:hypothetical protein
VYSTGPSTNLWTSSANHLDLLFTSLDENEAAHSGDGRTIAFSSIRTISPAPAIPRTQRIARQLERFPLIHKDHHNNKTSIAMKNRISNC